MLLVKTSAFSKLIVSTILPNPNKDFIKKKVEKELFGFIWKKTDKIKRNILYNSYENRFTNDWIWIILPCSKLFLDIMIVSGTNALIELEKVGGN